MRTDSNLCRKELTVHWSAPNSLIRSYLQPCTKSMWSCGSHYLIVPDCGCPKGGSFLSRSSHKSPDTWNLHASLTLCGVIPTGYRWFPLKRPSNARGVSNRVVIMKAVNNLSPWVIYGGVEGPPHIFFRHHAISYGWHSNSSVGDSNYCYVIRRTY